MPWFCFALTRRLRFACRVDAIPTIEQRQADLIRAMSPARRLEIAADLYETGWELKMAGLRSQHPDWTDSQIFGATRRAFLTGDAS